MAATVPAKLKSADIQRFATRAAQLEKYKPIVTYWSEYYIVNQILSRGLHTADEECTNYTTTLMDKLETYKTENASNDAVIDDVAAKAYIENFATETFQRAEYAQRSNKVSRQTADTFQAAATFLDLMAIWAPVDEEVLKKSKFAKFHALRIAKAIKAGEDPNATNPVVEEPQQAADENGLDQELRDMENAHRPGESGIYRPPTVESAPDSKQPTRPSSTLQGSPLAPPPLPERNMTPVEPMPLAPFQQEHDVSPVEPAENVASRQGSVGGGYFPPVPTSTSTYDTPMSDQRDPERQDVSMTTPPDEQLTFQPPPPPSQAAFSPSDFYNTSQPRTAPTPGSTGMPTPAPAPLPIPRAAPAPVPIPRAAPAPAPVLHVGPQPVPPGGYREDDESTLAAQKHAKWAISALNFEDVHTAVKELRLALGALGAT